MKRINLLLVIQIITVHLFSQSPVLLKDILNFKNGSSMLYGTGKYTLVNGITFFTADDGIHGNELWKTDGTEAGTVMVKDIFSGTHTSSASNLTNVNGTLFFSAFSDFDTNAELWKTDGTEAGTVMVKDIAPGTWASNPEILTAINGVLFFRAFTPAAGTELWKSDGTAAGTVLVKDIMPGTDASSPRSLVNVNGTLFFTAVGANSTHFNLWKSDGTEAGTVMVKNIVFAASSFSGDDKMVPVNNTLFFQAADATNGKELWKTDGTAAGTVMVKDINPTDDGAPTQLTVVDSILYFTATDGSEGTVSRLWKSNGTTAGTTAMTDAAANRITAYTLYNYNGKLFFNGNNGDGKGSELWKTDGTAPGTEIVKDIVPGTGYSSPDKFTNVNGSLYFITTADSIGLWKTDGTAAGTVNIQPGALKNLTWTDNFYSNGTSLYFTYTSDSMGAEPWKSDGTDTGTGVLKDINIITNGSSPDGFIQVGNIAFFTADDGIHGRELWKTDGTAAGTQIVKDIFVDGSSEPTYLTPMNGSLYFIAQVTFDNWKLFKSDGTEAGTVTIGNTDSSNSFGFPGLLINVDGTLFFSADHNLWKSDGTNAGTVKLKSNITGLDEFRLNRCANVNGTFYFTVSGGTAGTGHNTLWKSDGTTDGTLLIKDIVSSNTGNYLDNFTSFKGRLFFTTDDGIHGWELWVSDGTEAGTTLYKEFVPGAVGSFTRSLKVIGNSLYFCANNGTNPTTGMYKTDGTADGTIEITNISGNRFGNNQDEFTVIDSTVFFTAATISQSYELWKTSTAGSIAVLVKDIYPGNSALDPRPKYLTAVNGTLYFSDGRPANAEEIWKSDGSSAGTIPVDSTVAPLPYSSITGVTKFNNSLLFSATDPVHGKELWILKMEPFIWTGDISTEWEVPGNWSTNEVPTNSSVVMIPAGKTRYPVISVSTAVKSISCAAGSSVTVLPGVNFKLQK